MKRRIPYLVRKEQRANTLTMLACFGVPFLAMIVIYSCLQVWPVGENSVLVLDLNGQYIYFFEQMRDILVNGDSLLYSFERALGGEFMGIFAYYLSSPFSLLVALFPKTMITEALYLILVAKVGAAGLAFGYLLKKTRPMNAPSTILFSSMYALCTFSIVMQHNVMWMDNLIALPLILLGVDALIKEGRFRLYVLALVYSVFSNFYIGYMMCLFVLIWFFARYFMLSPAERNPLGQSAHFGRAFGRIALWSVVAILMTAVILLPTYYSLTFGKLEFSDPKYEPKQLFEFLDILTKAFFGSYDTVRPEGMPFIYCGTLALVLAPLYFFVKEIPLRRKIGMGVVMLFLLVSFNFSILELVWHGMQRPNWLNARFAFIFVGLEVLMAVDVYRASPKLGTKAVMASTGLWAILFLVLDKLEYDNLPTFLSVWPQLLCFVLIAAALPSCIRAMTDPRHPRAASIVLCAFVLAEAIGNGVVSLYQLDDDVTYTDRSTHRKLGDTYEEAAALFQDEDDDSFYRAEKHYHRTSNDNFAVNLKGLSNSTSTLNARAVLLLEQFGLRAHSHWSKYSGTSAVVDSLFDIRYVIVDEEKENSGVDYVKDLYTLLGSTEDGLDVYENPYALSLAFSAKEDVLTYALPNPEDAEKTPANRSYTDPFNYMNDLLSALTGEDIEVWRRVDVASVDQMNIDSDFVVAHHDYSPASSGSTAKLTWTLNVESEDRIYAYFASLYPRKASIKVNDEGILGLSGTDYAMRELGSFQVGDQVTVDVTLQEDNFYLRTDVLYFWYFDEEVFLSAVESLRDGCMDVHSTRDDKLWGTITVPAGDSVVFTTIPYDAGWNITVDGERVEPVAVLNETLLAFPITEGEHEIRMTYFPACMKWGLGLMVVGIAFFAWAWYSDKRRRDKHPTPPVSLLEPDPLAVTEAAPTEDVAVDANTPT